MLGHRLRRWPNIKPALAQRILCDCFFLPLEWRPIQSICHQPRSGGCRRGLMAAGNGTGIRCPGASGHLQVNKPDEICREISLVQVSLPTLRVSLSDRRDVQCHSRVIFPPLTLGDRLYTSESDSIDVRF